MKEDVYRLWVVELLINCSSVLRWPCSERCTRTWVVQSEKQTAWHFPVCHCLLSSSWAVLLQLWIIHTHCSSSWLLGKHFGENKRWGGGVGWHNYYWFVFPLRLGDEDEMNQSKPRWGEFRLIRTVTHRETEIGGSNILSEERKFSWRTTKKKKREKNKG